jgi:hypothetical protein
MDSPVARLIGAALTLAMVGAMMWLEMPEWQRQLAGRALRARSRAAAGWLARTSGRRAMGRELAGTPEHQAGYDRTERISRLRDAL